FLAGLIVVASTFSGDKSGPTAETAAVDTQALNRDEWPGSYRASSTSECPRAPAAEPPCRWRSRPQHQLRTCKRIRVFGASRSRSVQKQRACRLGIDKK